MSVHYVFISEYPTTHPRHHLQIYLRVFLPFRTRSAVRVFLATRKKERKGEEDRADRLTSLDRRFVR